MSDAPETPPLKARIRPTGVTASVGRTGFPHLTSLTGGTLDIVTGASQPGFNPIDLLYASLSACLVLSARIAASRMGILGAITEIRAEVTGEKTKDEPSRIARFDVVFTFSGDLDAATRHRLADAAEEICTVSNTLRRDTAFDIRLTD
ncbi:putative OsmC-like protein [Rhizobium sp. PP-F2F-G48]|uniref:OsmC family protein n=1 Tax=Rhizobium sp. PP-F2F-G48 TaxID=2135651 RepID=UPI0010522E79|nr:OsmC family protein [Rhizobium sp. PP-F2F-G48]TCM57682.1 putative OsmC-like protein [Rhizobium sp. PP-F2F-G48]